MLSKAPRLTGHERALCRADSIVRGSENVQAWCKPTPIHFSTRNGCAERLSAVEKQPATARLLSTTLPAWCSVLPLRQVKCHLGCPWHSLRRACEGGGGQRRSPERNADRGLALNKGTLYVGAACLRAGKYHSESAHAGSPGLWEEGKETPTQTTRQRQTPVRHCGIQMESFFRQRAAAKAMEGKSCRDPTCRRSAFPLGCHLVGECPGLTCAA